MIIAYIFVFNMRFLGACDSQSLRLWMLESKTGGQPGGGEQRNDRTLPVSGQQFLFPSVSGLREQRAPPEAHWLDPHFTDGDTEPRSEASLGLETPGLAPGGPGGLILKLLPTGPVRT